MEAERRKKLRAHRHTHGACKCVQHSERGDKTLPLDLYSSLPLALACQGPSVHTPQDERRDRGKLLREAVESWGVRKKQERRMCLYVRLLVVS